jgi:ArsR family transcriptional regulator, arsenate/arsenite/antimonite-responsive transcriptional repressor
VQAGPSGLAAGRIADALAIPPATLSFHLSQLAHAGLVASQREGRSIIYSADYSAMNALMAFLTDNCCGGDPSGCAPALPASTPTPTRPSRRAL